LTNEVTDGQTVVTKLIFALQFRRSDYKIISIVETKQQFGTTNILKVQHVDE